MSILPERVRQKFAEVYQTKEKIILVRAPGRVNLIGEHTDYNGGLVLPVAIKQAVYIGGLPRADREIHLYSCNMKEKLKFNLDAIKSDNLHLWGNYIKGVFLLLEEKVKLRGMNLLIEGDVPIGAGLSSSAAIEVACAYIAGLISGFKIKMVELAKLCQRAENEFVGTKCGLMDQLVCCVGKEGTALFLNCLNEKYRFIPFKDDNLVLIVCNTGVKRELASSKYNLRRRECGEALSILKKFAPDAKCLGDISPDMYEKHREQLPPAILKRCEHVFSENERVERGVRALTEGDVQNFGQLMDESHKSLRDKYEVSCKELDIMVEIARGVEGVLGARMTGGGFGGSTVNLVEKEAVPKFKEAVSSEYLKRTSKKAEIYCVEAGAGVRELEEN